MVNLKLRYIEVFLALMQSGSMQGAAKLLCTTQPSVSKALGALERQLGFRLFTRTGLGLKPTGDAYILLSEADRIREEMLSFQRVASDLREGLAGRLNIEISPALSISVVPKAVARFKHRWKDTRLHIGLASTDLIRNNIRKHLIDIGVVCFTPEENIQPIRILGSAPMVCIFPKSHVLAHKHTVSPQDLAHCPMVAYRASVPINRLVEQAFAETGIEQNIDVRVNQTSAICAIVNEGYGVSVVDHFSMPEKAYPNIAVRPFMPERIIHVGVVASEQRPASAQAEHFIAALRLSLSEHRGVIGAGD